MYPLNPGLQAAVYKAEEGGETVAKLWGDTYRLQYEGAIFTPGTGGIAIGPDQANLNGGGEYDLINAITGTRPDPSTALGFPSWLFTIPDFLEARNAPTALYASGEHPWITAVIRPNSTTTVSTPFEITDGGVNTGGAMQIATTGANIWRSRWNSAAGTKIALKNYSNIVDIAIVEIGLMTDRARIQINGAFVDSAIATTNGLAMAIDTVSMGINAAGGSPYPGHILALSGANLPDEDRKTSVRELYADIYGVTLSP